MDALIPEAAVHTRSRDRVKCRGDRSTQSTLAASSKADLMPRRQQKSWLGHPLSFSELRAYTRCRVDRHAADRLVRSDEGYRLTGR
jgi:hypothetical protein